MKFSYIKLIFKKIKFLNLLIFNRDKKRYKINLFGSRFMGINGQSFYHSYQEIFVQRLYHITHEKTVFNIIDCGANYGLSVIYFLRHYPNAKILAFEADPKIFEQLKENLSTYNPAKFELYNKAVFDSDGELEFYGDGGDSGSLVNKRNNSPIVKIGTVKLSNYLKNNIVDLLKIDIEGAEFLVLKEISGELRQVKHIFIEYHSFGGQEQTLNEILSILKVNNFRIYIKSQFVSKSPFNKKEVFQGMDMMLLIFGINESYE
ncbi:MAG: FkbM family methyltransferase [Leadbetterella sp.]|nr:FkbM family methyltransferase [Leadbetterella sp.]